MKTLCAAVMLMITLPLSAANLGVYGTVFPIAEPDLLQYFHAKLLEMKADGQMAKMQQQMTKNVIAHVLRPPAVEGVRTAVEANTVYYDPTFVVTRDIAAPSGQVIVKAGTSVNPLSFEKMTEVLLFINADDSAQVDWAKAEQQQFAMTKVILVQGNIKDAAGKLGRIYFDQDGVLCKKLGISSVPTLVRQTGTKLAIESVPSNQIIKGAQS